VDSGASHAEEDAQLEESQPYNPPFVIVSFSTRRFWADGTAYAPRCPSWEKEDDVSSDLGRKVRRNPDACFCLPGLRAWQSAQKPLAWLERTSSWRTFSLRACWRLLRADMVVACPRANAACSRQKQVVTESHSSRWRSFG